jgi:chemotaxis protein MotB
MGKKSLFYLLCLIGFLFSACVSKNQYVQLETTLTETRTRLDENSQQLTELQAKYQKLKDANFQLLDTIEDLKHELRQEKLTVLVKEQDISKLEAIRRDIETTLKEEIAQRDEALAEKNRIIQELDNTRREIEDNLKEQIAQKDIKIEEIEGKLKITFVDKILFDSGSAQIKAKGREVLLKLADSFRDNQDRTIVVEGHTDNVQIGSALQNRFPTNWELSTARSAAVVRFLQEKGGIEPERMTASGFSFYRPVASNETEEGRKQNRRIEITLVPAR